MRRQGLILKRRRRYLSPITILLYIVIRWTVLVGLVMLSLMAVQGCTHTSNTPNKLIGYCTTIAKPTIKTNKDLDSWAWLLEETSQLCGVKVINSN